VAARQPRIELGRLALADKGGEVLRKRDGLCQSGMFGELHHLVLILIRGLFWRAEDQPGCPAGGERPSWGVSHRRQRLSATALPWCQPLRLAHAPDVQSDNAILATKTLITDGAEEVRPIPTAPVPAVQEQRFIGIETAAIAISYRGCRSGKVGLWR
jgi:hypothetical protein